MSKALDPTDVRNWQRRDDQVTTSGKLEAKDVSRLAAIGVRHVVNLALDDHPEALADERTLLEDSGIEYTHIPVPFDAPTHSHLDELRTVLDREQAPVHVHCIMNYRVAAFFYLLDLDKGVSEHEARVRMGEIWDPLESDDPRALPWKKLLSQ